MLKLTAEEQVWLDAYRDALNKQHPEAVQEMLIYGSKARGQAHADSDLDVLLIVKNRAGGLKKDLRWIGYLLAAKTDVLPSILAYTQQEWESRRRSGSTFRKASSATQCALYEQKHGLGGVGQGARTTRPDISRKLRNVIGLLAGDHG
jgi:predicted nucleotidyltransferase